MILVVGAGIAGLASALCLCAYDDVLVAERRGESAANAGAGIQLAPNAMKALAAIGAADAVAQAASQPECLTVRTGGRGKDVTRLPYGDFPTRYGAPNLTLSRQALHGALLAKVMENSAITLRYNCQVGRLTDGADGPTCRRAGGPFGLVVAADGVNSAVRGQFVGDEPRETGYVAWRGEGGGADAKGSALTMLPGRHIVRYPIGRDHGNVVMVARERDRPPDRLTPRDGGRLLDDVVRWTPWPIAVRPRHVFRTGRIAFVGDASHAMVPFLAQGAAMALEDVAVLGASIASRGLTTDALADYEATRRQRTEKMAELSARQGSIYHLPPGASHVRDFAMARLGPSGILKRVDWIYRWAPPSPVSL
ncbi:MAG: FAD-dependent monooxygenase [Devosia sp.]